MPDDVKRIGFSQLKSETARKLIYNAALTNATVFVQQHWRKISRKFHNHSSNAKPNLFPIVTNNRDAHLSQARLIKNNAWEAINFKDNHFLYDLFNALETNSITLDDYVTAELLYHMSQHLQEALPLRHKNIIWDLANINYATQRQKQEFAIAHQELPKHQQGYFEINFSLSNELQFFSCCLNLLMNHEFDHFKSHVGNLFKSFLANRINWHQVDEVKALCLVLNQVDASIKSFNLKEQVYESLDDVLHGEPKNKLNTKQSNIIKNVLVFIEHKYRRMGIHKFSNHVEPSNVLQDSMAFLVKLFSINREQIPIFITISSEFDGKIGSPLLTLTLLSIPCYRLIAKILFGSHAVEPNFKIGILTPLTLRDCDNQNQRAIECVYPTLKRNAKPHDYDSLPSITMLHDILHWFRCSMNPEKNFLRDIRETLARDTKLAMNKNIWWLTDLDASTQITKEDSKDLDPIENQMEIKINWLKRVLTNLGGISFWTKPFYSEGFILLFDFIKYPAKFEKLTAMNLKQFFLALAEDYPAYAFDVEIFFDIINFVSKYPTKSLLYVNLYYILMDKAINHSEAGIIPLLNCLEDHGFLEKFFKWTKKQTLVFKVSKYQFFKIPIKDCSFEDLIIKINDILLTHLGPKSDTYLNFRMILNDFYPRIIQAKSLNLHHYSRA